MPTRSINELEIGEIQAMLESKHWDPPVHSWRVESDLDSLGDQALWDGDAEQPLKVWYA
jgi:hypothetical protein